MASEEPAPSVLSRIKAFESQAQNADSSGSLKPSRLIIDSDGDHEEDWVSVPITTAVMTPTTSSTSLAPPLPFRNQGHQPASSISSFHSISLSSSDSVTSLAIDSAHDVHKEEEDTVSLESEPYEHVDSTTSLGSPGAVAKLTADWNQLNQSRKPNLPSSLQRPQSAAPNSSGKHKPALPPPPRSASASFSSPVSSSTSNGRRPAPPPPSSNRTSTSTVASSDRSSILSVASSASSTTTNSVQHGYPPYQPYKPKPPPSPNKPIAPLKPPSLKHPTSSSTSSNSSVTSFSSVSTTGPGPSVSALALSRPTPVPTPARKRYEAVFDANLANLNIANASSASTSKPALLSPSAALAIPRKGWRGISIDLVTTDEPEDGTVEKEKTLNGNGYDGKQDVGQTELNRLPGLVVRTIWTKSRLNKDKLGAIWLECDPYHTGWLDREAFIKGMWRIDTELKREELSKTGRARRNGSVKSIRSAKSVGSVKRQGSTTSTTSTTSSSHSLRNVPSVGSLRRTPVPTPTTPTATSLIPPIPRIPQIPQITPPPPIPPRIPSPAPNATGTSGTTNLKMPSVPPPLPARKPTMGTGLGTGTGAGSKMDLGEDEVDLLL